MQVPERMLGAKADPKWRDMSDYLVHFTTDENALLSILGDAKIRAINAYGWFRTDPPTRHLHLSACFSEIPLDHLGRLVARRGHYAIGFRRDFVRRNGGARVWYLDEPGLQRQLFDAFHELRPRDPHRTNGMWHLSAFIDKVGENYDFSWEREWRVPGGLSFEPENVAFLILPDGTSPTLFVNDSGDAPAFRSDLGDFWDRVVDELGTALDRQVEQFLAAYVDPVNVLSWDEGYVWAGFTQYDTRDALDELFGINSPVITEALAERLDEISGEWVAVAEI